MKIRMSEHIIKKEGELGQGNIELLDENDEVFVFLHFTEEGYFSLDMKRDGVEVLSFDLTKEGYSIGRKKVDLPELKGHSRMLCMCPPSDSTVTWKHADIDDDCEPQTFQLLIQFDPDGNGGGVHLKTYATIAIIEHAFYTKVFRIWEKEDLLTVFRGRGSETRIEYLMDIFGLFEDEQEGIIECMREEGFTLPDLDEER